MSMYMDRLQLLRHDMFVLFVLMDCGWHLFATFFKNNFDELWQGFVQGDIVVFSYGMGQRGPQAQSPSG